MPAGSIQDRIFVRNDLAALIVAAPGVVIVTAPIVAVVILTVYPYEGRVAVVIKNPDRLGLGEA